jgi:hypothetical protein
MNTCGNVAGQALLALHLIHFSVGVSCPDSVVLLRIRSSLRGGLEQQWHMFDLALLT